MAEVIVAERLYVRNPSVEMERWAKTNLKISNPEYYKKERMGLYLGNTEPEIWLYEHQYIGRDYCLVLPFGVIGEFYEAFHKECSFFPIFATIDRMAYNSNINLFPYQVEAVEAILAKKSGIVVMPCGSGKTQTGLEAIARIGGRTLWLTHTKDLLNQSMSRAKSVFGIDADCYGTITEGKVNIGKMITFATVQTMVGIDLDKYKDSFDVVVVDECHHAVGSPTKCMQFYKVLSALKARYKIGLTATPKRSDGLDRCMFALIGGKIIEVDKSVVESRTCPVKVKFVETGFEPDEDKVLDVDGTILYQQLIDDLITNEERKDVVFSELTKIPKGAPTLVLANRVSYLKDMTERYVKNGLGKAVCLSGAGTSKKAREERAKALTGLNSGEVDCIFATYQLAKEGLDVPNLRYLVLATPERDKTTVIQSAGRVSRVAEGKDCGRIIDFVDDFGMYRSWRTKRLHYYMSLAFEIEYF